MIIIPLNVIAMSLLKQKVMWNQFGQQQKNSKVKSYYVSRAALPMRQKGSLSLAIEVWTELLDMGN